MPSDALALMLRLQRCDTTGVDRCLGRNPHALAELAAAALVGGMSVPLLHALEANAMTVRIGEEARRELTQRRERQRARYARLVRGLGEIATDFAAADVPFMLLKGPWLALRLHGDAEAREFLDLDLLVRESDRARALAQLAASGYTRRSRVIGGAAATARFVHGFDYVREGVSVDLHWRLSCDPSLAIDERGVWARAGVIRLDDHEYTVPADEDALTLAVLGLLRDIERARPKYKNVVELAALAAAMDATSDWDALFARGRREGTLGPLVNVLALVLDETDAHALAPRLADTVAQHAGRRVPLPRAASLLAPGAAGVRLPSRLWAARAHDTSFVRWLAWRIVSLPFRRAAHGWPRPVAPGSGRGA